MPGSHYRESNSRPCGANGEYTQEMYARSLERMRLLRSTTNLDVLYQQYLDATFRAIVRELNRRMSMKHSSAQR